jgi:hypothetical protein
MTPTEQLLKQFTPAMGPLDRDELLFQAGQASARSTTPWARLVFGLCVLQIVTVVLLLMLVHERDTLRTTLASSEPTTIGTPPNSPSQDQRPPTDPESPTTSNDILPLMVFHTRDLDLAELPREDLVDDPMNEQPLTVKDHQLLLAPRRPRPALIPASPSLRDQLMNGACSWILNLTR